MIGYVFGFFFSSVLLRGVFYWGGSAGKRRFVNFVSRVLSDLSFTIFRI